MQTAEVSPRSFPSFPSMVSLLTLLMGGSMPATAAESCPPPVRRDALPAMEAAQAEELLANALDRASRACTLDTVGCDDAKERCRSSAQLLVNRKPISELQAPFLTDIQKPYLGKVYVPMEKVAACPPLAALDCSAAAEALGAAAAARQWAAASLRQTVREWGRWYSWASATSEQCRSQPGPGTAAVVVPASAAVATAATSPLELEKERLLRKQAEEKAVAASLQAEQRKAEQAQALEKAKQEAQAAEKEAQARRDALAKREQELAKAEAERKERLAKEDAERKARLDAEERARQEAERSRAEAEEKRKEQALKAEREQRAREEARRSEEELTQLQRQRQEEERAQAESRARRAQLEQAEKSRVQQSSAGLKEAEQAMAASKQVSAQKLAALNAQTEKQRQEILAEAQAQEARYTALSSGEQKRRKDAQEAIARAEAQSRHADSRLNGAFAVGATSGAYGMSGASPGSSIPAGVTLLFRQALWGPPPLGGGTPSGVEFLAEGQYLTRISGNTPFTLWRAAPQIRGWLRRFGLGVAADYRQMFSTASAAEGPRSGSSLFLGPSAAVALVDRQVGRLVLTGKWFPLIDGATDVWAADLEGGAGLFFGGLEFLTLHTPSSSSLQRGWSASCFLGVRAGW